MNLTNEEKNVLIAVERGWRLSKPVYGHDMNWRRRAYLGACTETDQSWAGEPCDVSEDWRAIPDYFTDASAALTLCDAMKGEGWHLAIDRMTDALWKVAFAKTVSNGFVASAPTLPAAICEAFGKVKELWK